ncbi:hypothetical protein DH2020_033048 [Rehmannia glutinosa]|uniref:phosphoribosylglycinamide formyltransferase 1 n=1 Tax=Rehmannia glutinosa TaxID=99300 RepID=A0ABR0VGS8_REHGL
METRNAILRASLHSAALSIQIPENHSFSTLTKIHSPKWVSLNIRYSFSSRTLLVKSKTQCRNSYAKIKCKGVSDIEEESPKPKLRRKIWRFLYQVEAPISGRFTRQLLMGLFMATLSFWSPINKIVEVQSMRRDNRIPVIVFPNKKDGQEVFSAEDLVITLRSYKVDFILLAGYLKLIPVELVRAYPKSIFNIHPSLLPAFGGKGYYGMKVHKAVIASGARYSGPTIHYVDEQYDTGRILAQRVVPVLANDTAEELAARVLHEEHQLYVDVAAALCEERITWREDGVPLIQSKENPNEYF